MPRVRHKASVFMVLFFGLQSNNLLLIPPTMEGEAGRSPASPLHRRRRTTYRRRADPRDLPTSDLAMGCSFHGLLITSRRAASRKGLVAHGNWTINMLALTPPCVKCIIT